MGLETGTYIQDLNQSNPIGGDRKAQGDDHLRLIKTVLKNSFPNATRPFYFPTVLAKSAVYTILEADAEALIEADTSGGAFTLSLPTLDADAKGFKVYIAKVDDSVNALTVDGDGGEDIDGQLSLILRRTRQMIMFIWSGSEWLTDRNAALAEPVNKATSVTLLESELDLVTATTSIADVTLTLPPAADVKGRFTSIKKLTAAFDVIIEGDAAETVEGETSIILRALNESVVLFSTGAAWIVVGQTPTTMRQTFNAAIVHGLTTLVDGAAIDWDLSEGGPDYQVTLGGNRTLNAFTNGAAGQKGLLRIIQDGTGGRTLDLSNAVYDYWGPVIEDIARGVNELTEYEYEVISGAAMILRRKGASSIMPGGRDLLDVKTAAASATIDFVLTKWLALYDRFEIDFDNLLPATDGTALWFRTSTNGGSSYDAGAADYNYIYTRLAAATNDGQGVTGESKIELVPTNANISMSNVAGETVSGTVILYSPSATGRFKIQWNEVHFPVNPTFLIVRNQGIGLRDTLADVDAVRFLCSSGNIASGTFRLYGLRK